MSTVTSSTSNVERSPTFLAKQTAGKGQSNNQTTQPFAALLMAAEEPEPEGSADLALGQTTTDTKEDKKGEQSDLSDDNGQAALTGLLNWQALSIPQGKLDANNPTPANIGPEQPGDAHPSEIYQPVQFKAVPETFRPSKLTDIKSDVVQLNQPTSLQLKTTQTPSSEQAITDSLLAPGTTLINAPQTTAGLVETVGRPVTNHPNSPSEWWSQGTTGRAITPRGLHGSNGMTRVNLNAQADPTVQSLPVNEAITPPRATIDLENTTVARAPVNTTQPEGEDKEANASGKAESGRSARADLTSMPDSLASVEPAQGQPDSESVAPLQTPSADQMTEVLDELTGQIAYWASQGTQKAKMTLGDALQGMLDVDVVMRDGEVHVAFEAARDAVSDALINSAETLLRDMLEDKGMTLGDVTFTPSNASSGQEGFTSRQANDDRPLPSAASRRDMGATSADNGAVTKVSAPARPNIATAEKLDLFA